MKLAWGKKLAHIYFSVMVLACFSGLPVLADSEKLQLVDAQFGRLFTYPSSRDLLDKYRHTGLPPELGELAESGKNQNERTSSRSKAVTVSGVMLTEGGKHRVWLQDNNHDEASQDSSVARAGKPFDNSTKVLVHAQRKSRLLKPGQVWLLDEQRVQESYELKQEQVQIKTETEAETEVEVETETEAEEKKSEQGEKAGTKTSSQTSSKAAVNVEQAKPNGAPGS